jgi:hypothetical protein
MSSKTQVCLSEGWVITCPPGPSPNFNNVASISISYMKRCAAISSQTAQKLCLDVVTWTAFGEDITIEMHIRDVVQVHHTGVARSAVAATTLRDKIYICGGKNKACGLLASGEEYAAGRDDWYPLPEMKSGRCHHKLTALGSRIYATGGDDKDGQPMSTIEWLDPSEGHWTAV